MKYGILYGTNELTIDDKNRLLIPSSVRKELEPDRDGEAFFLVLGINQKIWFFPEKFYQEMASQESPQITPTEEAHTFAQMHYGLAEKVGWDKQGRLVVPDKMLKRSGTNKDVALVGIKDHLELWNRADWDARVEELDRQRVEMAQKPKQ